MFLRIVWKDDDEAPPVKVGGGGPPPAPAPVNPSGGDAFRPQPKAPRISSSEWDQTLIEKASQELELFSYDEVESKNW
jgi:hypothetical protein